MEKQKHSNGDSSANCIEAAYRNQKPRLLARLRAAGRTLEEAEELVHDIYAETMERVSIGAVIANLPAWINSLLTRRLIDLWRHDRVRAAAGARHGNRERARIRQLPTLPARSGPEPPLTSDVRPPASGVRRGGAVPRIAGTWYREASTSRRFCIITFPMDASIINPFLNSAMRLFHDMFFLTPTYGKPFLVEPGASHRWEISGVIGIVGSHEGIVVLRVTTVLATKLLEKSGLVFTDEAERLQTMNEMISEFVNIISGGALPELKDKDVELTPPFTVKGKNHTLSWPGKAPIIGVPFFTNYGPFEMQVSIVSRKDGK
jgi:chemotaxis protein CheX